MDLSSCDLSQKNKLVITIRKYTKATAVLSLKCVKMTHSFLLIFLLWQQLFILSRGQLFQMVDDPFFGLPLFPH